MLERIASTTGYTQKPKGVDQSQFFSVKRRVITNSAGYYNNIFTLVKICSFIK